MTDGRTDRQTDRITIPKTALAYMLREVKSSLYNSFLEVVKLSCFVVLFHLVAFADEETRVGCNETDDINVKNCHCICICNIVTCQKN